MICALFIDLNSENELAIILLHHGFQMENWGKKPYSFYSLFWEVIWFSGFLFRK